MTRQRLEQRLEEVEGSLCNTGDVLNLPGCRTKSYKETADDIIIFAELLTEPAEVCSCGGAYQKWGFAEPAYYHDLPIRSKRVRVYFDRQRYRCLGCNTTILQPIPGVEDHRRLTTRLLHYIENEYLNIFRTCADVADELGYSEQSIRDIGTQYAKRLEEERRIDAPPWIAIDEVHLAGQYRCVITDPINQRVIDILPTNSQEALKLRLLRLPGRQDIRIVTIDMWGPYKGAVQMLLGGAVICVDRYHVHNMLNCAIKDVLALLREGMTHTEQRKGMRDPNILLASRYHLEEKDKKRKEAEEEAKKEAESAGKTLTDEETQKEPCLIEIRDKWFEERPDLATAYGLKEKFSDILQLWDRQEAEIRTDLWLIEVHRFIETLRSKYGDDPDNPKGKKWKPPFSNVLTTIKSWRPEILNYIDCKDSYAMTTTNFFAEHVNGKIKRANVLCNGLDFETLRAKVLHGGVMVKRRPPHPLSEPKKRPRAERPRRRMEINPDSNLEQLKRAREERDDTKDFRPKPRATPGLATSFLSTPYSPAPAAPRGDAGERKDEDIIVCEDGTQRHATDTEGEAGAVALPPLPPDGVLHPPDPEVKAAVEVPTSEKRAGKGRRKGPNSDPNQLTMF
jgi:transposase